MMPIKNKLSSFLLLAAFATIAAACSKFDDMFSSSDHQPPLKGTRISVLQLQAQLVPNPELQQTPIALPAAWMNMFWPQAGGYPNHVMGQLSLGKDLKKAWSSSVGSSGSRRDPLIA